MDNRRTWLKKTLLGAVGAASEQAQGALGLSGKILEKTISPKSSNRSKHDCYLWLCSALRQHNATSLKNDREWFSWVYKYLFQSPEYRKWAHEALSTEKGIAAFQASEANAANGTRCIMSKEEIKAGSKHVLNILNAPETEIEQQLGKELGEGGLEYELREACSKFGIDRMHLTLLANVGAKIDLKLDFKDNVDEAKAKEAIAEVKKTVAKNLNQDAKLSDSDNLITITDPSREFAEELFGPIAKNNGFSRY